MRSHWLLNLYPEAAEAGGCWRKPGPVVRSGPERNPERAAAEAVRRARGKIRRYGVANRLNRLGTLTYAGTGCHDPAQLREDIAEFFKALRPSLGGKAFPYVWVPEWHPGGHGLHVHFVVSRYVGQTLIRDTWGRGHVHIKLLGDLPVGSGTVGEARLAARYLGKYVGKGVDNAAGIRLALAHLRELDLHSVAFVGAKIAASSYVERLGAYRKDVAEGFDPSSQSAILLGDSSIEWGRSAATEIVRTGLPGGDRVR